MKLMGRRRQVSGCEMVDGNVDTDQKKGMLAEQEDGEVRFVWNTRIVGTLYSVRCI